MEFKHTDNILIHLNHLIEGGSGELKYYTLNNKMIPEDLAELNTGWQVQRRSLACH
jgi:hypothetical protein